MCVKLGVSRLKWFIISQLPCLVSQLRLGGFTEKNLAGWGGGGRRRAKPKKVCYVEFVGEFSWRFLEFSKYVWNGRGGGGSSYEGGKRLGRILCSLSRGRMIIHSLPQFVNLVVNEKMRHAANLVCLLCNKCCISPCLSLFLPLSLSLFLSHCLSLCVSFCRSVCLPVCLSVSPSFSSFCATVRYLAILLIQRWFCVS